MNKKYDAILIPLGGLKKDGTPHPWVKKRLDKALEVQTGREFIVLLGRGTVSKPPPYDKNDFPIDECSASARYLSKKKFPANRILLEKTSLDTIGNAAFARALFTDPMNFKNLLVVNSEYHMPRTKIIFNWVYGLKPLHLKYSLDFLTVSDDGSDPKLIKLRLNKEKRSLKLLMKNKKGIETISKFHYWLFTRHGAYAYGRKPDRLRGKIIETY